MALTKYANMELLDLPNCDGLSDTGKCMWLVIPYCRGKGCPFQKTPQERQNAQKRTFRRMAGLDEKNQKRIADKYFGGERPWC